MYFITKNKIADYIQQHPEAQTAFLTWIKEFPYSQGRNTFQDIDNKPIEYIITAGAGLGRGEYQIKFKLNPWLKTGYIIWLGTNEGHATYEQEEFEKMKMQHPGLERKVKKITVVIQGPSPGSPINTGETKTTSIREPHETPSILVGRPVDLTNVHLGNAPEIFPSKIKEHIASEQVLKTKSEYESTLNRAIDLFETRPGTAEFDELTSLLLLIKHYEATNIELPRLALLDAIKYKMQMIELPTSALQKNIGSQQEVDQFLMGKSTLPEETLQAICDFLFIRIPLNDSNLIK